MRTIDIHEAKVNLFQLVEQAAKGKSFLIAISGTPRVAVLPLDSTQAGHLRRVGLLERCLDVAEEGDRSDAAPRSVRDLRGMLDAPAKRVSIEDMNCAIVARGATARCIESIRKAGTINIHIYMSGGQPTAAQAPSHVGIIEIQTIGYGRTGARMENEVSSDDREGVVA